MAHKKGASSSRNGRDSNAQRLGVKRFGGQIVEAARSSSGSADPFSSRRQRRAWRRRHAVRHRQRGRVEFNVRRGRRVVGRRPCEE